MPKKLNDEAVRDIKRRLALGERPSNIAFKHNISMTVVSLIRAGARYAKIKN